MQSPLKSTQSRGSYFFISSFLVLFAFVALAVVSRIVINESAAILVSPPNEHGFPMLWSPRQFAIPNLKTRFVDLGGRPRTRLAYYRLEPRHYLVESGLDEKATSRGSRWNLTLNVKDRGDYTSGALGTIIMLHGFHRNKSDLLPAGLCLADRGYTVILPDLRGHGESSKVMVSFGPAEASDIIKMIDKLKRDGQITEPIGIMGVSMGAAVALECAARDERIKSVVTLEPMPRLVDVFRHVANTPTAQPLFIGDSVMLSWALKWLRYGRRIEAVVARAGQITRQPIRAFDPRQSMRKINVPVLIVHGLDDNVVPIATSRSLIKLAQNKRSKLVTPRTGHVSLPVQLELWRKPMQDWFDQTMPRPSTAPIAFLFSAAPAPARAAVCRARLRVF